MDVLDPSHARALLELMLQQERLRAMELTLPGKVTRGDTIVRDNVSKGGLGGNPIQGTTCCRGGRPSFLRPRGAVQEPCRSFKKVQHEEGRHQVEARHKHRLRFYFPVLGSTLQGLTLDVDAMA